MESELRLPGELDDGQTRGLMNFGGPDIVILDYGMGNLRSVVRAVEKVGGRARLAANGHETEGADALIFPGQGAISATMDRLKETGLDRLIRKWIEADRPFLGICLGLQVLFERSEEGDVPGLGIFPGQVRRFPFDLTSGIKVPHMGWNAVEFRRPTVLGEGLAMTGEQFYFVHSYRVQTDYAACIWGETEYGGDWFVSAISIGQCTATQFHPEKSQAKGLQIYRNFVHRLK
ncbi:MAG: imidazole glycerol phosphate synthase subunit HisH [Puniceicoccaceae bacterium]